MKNYLKFRFIFIALIYAVSFSTSFQLKAQDEKNTVRLKTQYVKIMGGESYIDIKATSRINKQNTEVSNIDLLIYNELGENKIKLGKATTNMHGKTRFSLKSIQEIAADSSNTYNLLVEFVGNDLFDETSNSITFKNINIETNLYEEDSINYISATLIDPITRIPVADAYLDVQIKRLFKPLKIGEEFNVTDENGTVIVSIAPGIPGIDGILTIEVVLNESEEFGTVKAMVNAPLGTPVVNESTFDQRTMWSPRNKTPLFLLIFPNLLIFGVWGLIIYLITNLFKITKS